MQCRFRCTVWSIQVHCTELWTSSEKPHPILNQKFYKYVRTAAFCTYRGITLENIKLLGGAGSKFINNWNLTCFWPLFKLPNIDNIRTQIVNICLHVQSTWRRTMLSLSLRNTSGTSWLFWPWGHQWNRTWATNRDQSRNTGHVRFFSAVSPLAETSGIQGIILQEFVGKLKSQNYLILW